jgi:hypothetical protein
MRAYFALQLFKLGT